MSDIKVDAMLQPPHNDYTDIRKQYVHGIKANINEAAMLQPHNNYTDMRNQYEHGLYSADRGCTHKISKNIVLEKYIFYC